MDIKIIKKMALATLCGSLVLFIWGGFSHMVLFVGTGFSTLPNEGAVMEALQNNIQEQGLYFFPGRTFRNASKEQEAAFENKFRSGPTGILVYRPVGGDPISSGKLVKQLLSNTLSAFIAVVIVFLTYAGFWPRVFTVTLLGLVASVAVGSIYWNWYGFPTSFFLAQIADMLIGFFLTGLVICRIVPQATLVKNEPMKY